MIKGSENSHHGQQHVCLLNTKTATVQPCAMLEPNALTVIMRVGGGQGCELESDIPIIKA